MLLGEACEALSLAECLTTGNAWGRTTLSAWERVLSVGEACELPAWEIAPSAWEEHYLPGKCLPGRLHSLLGEQCLPGKTGYCLPGRSHSLPGKECYLLGKPGNCLPKGCLPGRSHSLPGKEWYLPGKPGSCLPEGCLPGRLHSLPGKEYYLLGKPGNCLSEQWCSLLGEEYYLPGKFEGKP